MCNEIMCLWCQAEGVSVGIQVQRVHDEREWQERMVLLLYLF